MVQIEKEPERVAEYLTDIKALADSNRSSLGFLPGSVYEDQCVRGNLLVAVGESKRHFRGYLLFGARFPHLRVGQLAVTKDSRFCGIADTLLAHLTDFGEANGYITVRARVAADLPANRFWEKAGFKVLRQEKGGVSSNRTINVRLKELVGTSLFRTFDASDQEAVSKTYDLRFNGPRLTSNVYAIDLNVILDALRNREFHEYALGLIAGALANEYRLFVTPEFTAELERAGGLAGSDDPLLTFARNLPAPISHNRTEVESIADSLRPIVFPEQNRSPRRIENDNSDLTHLAYCIYHGFTGFVTREKALLRASHAIQDRYGLEILTPADVVSATARSSLKPLSRIQTVDNSELSVRDVGQEDRKDLRGLLDSLGADAQEISRVLSGGVTHRPRQARLGMINGELLGFASWTVRSQTLPTIDACVFVDETKEHSARLIDHFLEALQECIPHSTTGLILLDLPRSSEVARETCFRTGYRLIGGTPHDRDKTRMAKVSHAGPVSESTWARLGSVFSSVTGYHLSCELPSEKEAENSGVFLGHPMTKNAGFVSRFDFESIISPGLMLNCGREATIIPIKIAYSRHLIGQMDGQADMFETDHAESRLERAYFMNPRSIGRFSPGQPIIFYVSKTGGGPGAAIGMARVTSAQRRFADSIGVGLLRQGILTFDAVRQCADRDGNVGVLTFDCFLHFPAPVDHSRLRNIGAINEANLVTSQKLENGEFVAVLRAAGYQGIDL